MTNPTPGNRVHARPRLPHLDPGSVPQVVTFRLADAIPAARIREWAQELAHQTPFERTLALRLRFDAALDLCAGDCHLRDPRIARIVEDSLRHFDGVRYRLHAWVVIPNHVHVLVTPLPGWRLATIVQAWKGFTAKRANEVLGRTGTFWQADYFDRVIRDERHFALTARYIEENPVKARLCLESEDWAFGSARVKGPAAHCVQRAWTPGVLH